MSGARHHDESVISPQEVSGLLGQLLQFDHVALAVSGGPDSMALMWMAADWAASQSNAPKLSVVTVDHGLRDESRSEARKVAAWADDAGLAHNILKCSGIGTGSRVQAAAREARYDQIWRWCRSNKAQAVVLAHTLDDQAETVVMRLARGSGVDGLSAMRAITMREDIVLYRPFLGIAKQRLIATLKIHGHDWINDPSNADQKFERVRLRAAMPALAEIGLTPEMLAQTAVRMARVRDALDGTVEDVIAQAAQVSPAGFCVIDHHVLANAPDEIAMRVLERTLIAVGGGWFAPRQERLMRLHRQIKDGAFMTATLGGCVMRRRGNGIVFVRETRRSSPALLEVRSGQSLLWDGRIRVSVKRNGPDRVVMRPLGAQGWRKLGDIRTRLPILPAFMRNALGSLWHNDSLIGICGLEDVFERCGVETEFVDRGLLKGAANLEFV